MSERVLFSPHLFHAILNGMGNPTTLTIDLVDSGAINLLRDMECRNLIRVNPPVNGNTEIMAVGEKTPP